MKKTATTHFTLIEILVVITIISILMAILLPVMGTIRERARRFNSSSSMASIKLAIQNYEADFLQKPFSGSADACLTDTEYDTMIEALIKGDNTRGKSYLDPTSNYNQLGIYADAWGQRFKIYLDLDYDKKVTINGKTLIGDFFIYSTGSDKTDQYGEEDDVATWKQ